MLSAASRSAPRWFIALWLFVIFVSVHDSFVALNSRDSLSDLERNPLGQILIQLNGGSVWYLLAAKLLGTVVAASLLLLVHQYSPRLALPITAVVASLQLLLLLYLLLG